MDLYVGLRANLFMQFLSFTSLCATADGKLLQCTLVGLKFWPF